MNALGERKAVVAIDQVSSLPLQRGWKRSELNDAGRDGDGNQLVEVIDREVWRQDNQRAS